MDNAAPRIAVIVATRNRPDDLARLLDSVRELDHDSFEVVVADQSEPAHELVHDPRFVHLRLSSIGKSAGLNAGIAATSAPLLAFTDDDCTVPPDWLTRAEELFARHPEIDLAYGDLKPIDWDPSEYFVPGGTLGRFEIVRGTGAIAQRGGAGANLLARRSTFDVVGAWDERIGPGSVVPACEEFDIYYRALARGLNVARVPSIEVLHWGGRRFDDGSAARLLNAYTYGEGAVIGKHLRIDRRMVAPAVRMAAADLYQLAMSVAYDHARGAHAYAERWRGIAFGITNPVDRERGVFAPASAGGQSASRSWRKNARVSPSDRAS